MTSPHNPEDRPDIVAGAPTGAVPGAFAGGPTTFDVVLRSVLAARTAIDAATQATDAAIAALYLLAPEPYREHMRRTLFGDPERAEAPDRPTDPRRGSGGEKERPATFTRREPSTE